MSDDKKRLNLIRVEEGTFSWLVNRANAHGMAIGDFAGELLDECALTWKPPTDVESDRMLFWNSVQVQQEEQKRRLVYQAAAIYQNRRNPTEEEAERLASMCEEAGMDYREVIKEVGSDPFSSVVAFSRNGSAAGQCMRWLADTMKNRRVMPAKLIEVKAGQEGFSPSTLSRARRAINLDERSPTIATRKRGRGWEWYIDEEEDQELPLS